MTIGRPRRRRRRTKSREAAAGTHISSLSDDIVREIFLLLPSLATLVRAALACRSWRRAVASSPAFRRRFRALHPAPPLLGLFVNTRGLYAPPCVPAFVPVVGSGDRDLAAAVRGGDFFLTALMERSGEASDWKLLDCCGNYVFVANWGSWGKEAHVVLNPLMRRSEHAFDEHPVAHDSHYGEIAYPRLVCSDKDPTSSFHVVLLEIEGYKLRASVFSNTGEWSVLHADVPVPDWSDSDDDSFSLDDLGSISVEENGRMQSQANGLIYWIYRWYRFLKAPDDQVYVISLDTASMEFSFAELPKCLSSCAALEAGETKDGAACIVYLDGLSVGVVKHTRDDDGGGAGRWVPSDTVVPLDGELERVLGRSETDAKLSLLAVRVGYAYLSTSVTSRDPWRPAAAPRTYCWFVSLCLETMKLEKLLQRTGEFCDRRAIPYIMTWPPCLLANNGRFALDDALGNATLTLGSEGEIEKQSES